MAAVVRAYPYRAVPRLRKAEVAAASLVRRYLGPPAISALSRWTREYLAVESHDTSLRLRSTAERLPPDLTQRSPRACSYALLGPSGHVAGLILDGPLVTALASAALRAPSAFGGRAGTPSPAERGLVTFGLTWLLARMGTASSWRLQPSADTASWRESLAFEWQVRIGTTTALAWLVVPRSTLEGIAPHEARPQILPANRLRGVVLDLPCVTARCMLAAREVVALQPGDLIAFGRRAGGSAQPVLMVGLGAYPVEAKADRLTITGPYSRSAQTMTDSSKDSSSVSAEAVTLAEDVEVEVVVEMGRVEISAMELLQLGGGDVLTLRKPCGALVDVRAGSRLVARGELVDVDGETGVRLVEVLD